MIAEQAELIAELEKAAPKKPAANRSERRKAAAKSSAKK